MSLTGYDPGGGLNSINVKGLMPGAVRSEAHRSN